MDAIRPQVDVVHPGQVPMLRNARCSAFHVSVSRVITAADKPAAEPRKCP